MCNMRCVELQFVAYSLIGVHSARSQYCSRSCCRDGCRLWPGYWVLEGEGSRVRHYSGDAVLGQGPSDRGTFVGELY